MEKIFQGKYSLKILKKINDSPNGCSITELAKELNVSKSVVFKYINFLVNENILTLSRKGKSKFYKLNEENYFVREIVKKLFELEDKVIDRVKTVLIKKIKKVKALSVILYGSFLTPMFDFKSDIDLMIIVKKKEKVKKKIESIAKYFANVGIILFIDVMEISEFKKLYKIKEPLIMNVTKNGIILDGKHPLELV